MGFEDIKTDGLSIDTLKKELEKYNKIYFGEDSFSLQKTVPTGQLKIYNKAKQEFLETQFNDVKSYFKTLKWDVIKDNENYIARANENVFIKFGYNPSCFIEFQNNDITKKYTLEIESEFKENPYYVECNDPHGWGTTYRAKKVEATEASEIKKRLDEIKSVIEHNVSLKGAYNFRIMINENLSEYCEYTVNVENKTYESIMDILKEISKKYF